MLEVENERSFLCVCGDIPLFHVKTESANPIPNTQTLLTANQIEYSIYNDTFRLPSLNVTCLKSLQTFQQIKYTLSDVIWTLVGKFNAG